MCVFMVGSEFLEIGEVLGGKGYFLWILQIVDDIFLVV